MSGGRFCYVDSQLKSEIFGWADKPRNVFEDREISELVWDVLDLIHEYDWYESGDTGKDDYLKVKRKFKNKWFGDSSKRQKKIIDEAIADLKKELAETKAQLANHNSDDSIDKLTKALTAVVSGKGAQGQACGQ